MNRYENLDPLFEQARKSSPLFGKDEVKQILSSPSPVVKPQRFSTTKTWIVGAAAVIVIYGTVYFMLPNEGNSPKAVRQTSIINDTIKEEARYTMQSVEEVPLQTSSKKRLAHGNLIAIHISNSENSAVVTHQSVEPKTEEAPQYPEGSSVIYPEKKRSEAADDLNELHLTNDELANFGIITDGNSLGYSRTIDTARIITDAEKNDLAYAYNFVIDKFGSTATRNVRKYDLIALQNPGMAIPLIICLKNRKDNSIRYMIGDHYVPPEFKDKYINDIRPGLVPIVVHTKAQPMIYSQDNEISFWFKNNEAFRDALPEELRQEVRNTYPEFNESEYSRYVEGLINLKKNDIERNVVSNEKRAEVRNRWITLSRHDLKKLHIKFNGRELVYKQTYKALNGEYVRKELIISPDNFFNGNYEKVPHVFTSGTNNCYAWYATDTVMNLIFNFVDIVDELKDSKKYFETIRATNSTFMERMNSMVPVYFAFDEKEILKSKEKNPVRVQILWFPKNESFLKALPKDAVAKINGMRDEETPEYHNRKINTASLKLLQLNEEELSGLGVKADHDGISVPSGIENGKPYYTKYSKMGTQFGINIKFKARAINDPAKNKFQFAPSNTDVRTYIEPVLVTDDLGNYWRSFRADLGFFNEDIDYMAKNNLNLLTYKKSGEAYSKAEQNIISRISTMIPVLVRTGDRFTAKDKKNKRWRPDVILWYEPTDSFFASLPKKLADEIKAEYTAIIKDQPIQSCNYFEACQSVKGKISEYSVYPNPANDDLNVMIDLAEERKLSVSLRDISGRVVKSLETGVGQAKGKKEYRFQIGEVKEGMYVLLIESDNGERVTQRIIKK